MFGFICVFQIAKLCQTLRIQPRKMVIFSQRSSGNMGIEVDSRKHLHFAMALGYLNVNGLLK